LNQQRLVFFAALDIATKITRGCVEILNDVKLCDKGKKVGSSEAALLQMLDIKPFTYGLKVVSCWEGSIFAPAFLDFTEENLFKSISVGITQVASLSLGLSYPTLPAFKHVVVNGFRNLVAVCLETNYNFEAMLEIRKRVENPDAYAVVSAPVKVEEKKKEPKKEEPKVEVKKEEEPEEEDAGGLMDFF